MFECGTQDEFSGVEDEGLVADVDEVGQAGLLSGRVDEGVFVVVEKLEIAVQAHIYRGGLHIGGVERVDDDVAGVNQGTNITIRNQHPSIVAIFCQGQSGDRVRNWTYGKL